MPTTKVGRLKRKLEQYKGFLKPRQVAAGINAAITNAKRLADDAALLLESGRYPSALSLAVLSIEESGKVPILRSLALARNPEEIAEAWHEYRSHTRKNVMWMFLDLFAKGARRADDFNPLFYEESDHPFLLDMVKQVSFYTDCLGNAHWSLPSDVVDEDLSRSIVYIAQLLATKRQRTEREIELYVKHLKPVWKSHKELMEMALVQWYQEMQDEGLLPAGENEMERLILYGVHASNDK